MAFSFRSSFLAALILSALIPLNALTADIANIDEKGDSIANMGQFVGVTGSDPASSPGQVEEILDMGNQNTANTQSGSLPSGVLWSLFDSQGISSLDQLALSMGINESGTIGTNWVTVESLRLTIQSPSNVLIDMTDIDFDTPDDNTVHVWNYAQGANTAEAQFSVNLGFDFMSTFNANSTSLIELGATVTNRTAGSEIFFFDPVANISSIPEPAATPLLILAGLSALGRRRHKSAKA